MKSVELETMLKQLTVKDLRVQTRARGLSPAGGVEALKDRLKEHMISTGDYALKTETGEDQPINSGTAGASTHEQVAGSLSNNYVRPAGQNVGNFITDRPSSRVLAAPGGASQIVFGDAEPAPLKASQAINRANPITGQMDTTATKGGANNNYARPAGQNVGNFITDRPSSRVLAAPGGASQITFG